MSFASWQDFFAMGGHAVYVWSAYGLALLVLGFNLLMPLLAQRRFFREQRRRPVAERSPRLETQAETPGEGAQGEPAGPRGLQ